MRKKILIVVTLIALALAGAFIYAYYMKDYEAKHIAETYVNAWDTGKTPEQFTQTLKAISDQHFLDQNLNSAVSAYSKRTGHLTGSIQKIFIIDRHNFGEQAVVYYSEMPSKQLLQANIILYNTSDGFKIHDAEIMHRSSAPIPTSASQVEQQYTVRYLYLQNLVKKWIEYLNSGDEKDYLSYFSSTAPITDYKAKFDAEQKEIKEKHLKLNIVSTGILVLISTDLEADIVSLNNQTTDGKSQIVPLHLNMALDKGDWKITGIYAEKP